jgi:PilZ domain
MLLGQGPVSEDSRERRAMRRFIMKLPASVRVSGIPSEFSTETENVSARGIFFYLDRWMTEGARVEVTMAFPSQVTLTDPVRVRFLARVVRVVPGKTATRVGVGAVIEEYEFIRSSDESQDFAGMQPGWNFSH